jgi:hypothetical protein
MTLLVAAGLAGGCGGDDGIAIGVSLSPAIAQEAVRAKIALYNAPASCNVIRISNKSGIYEQIVAIGERGTEFFDVTPNPYQIAVFVYDASDALIGFGCDPTAVIVESGRRTMRGPITVGPLP